jgi:hypothetical protein
VLVQSSMPGGAGNLIDVVVVKTAGALSASVAVVDGRTVVTVDLGASGTEDCDSVAGIINNALSGTYGIVFATVVGVGATVVNTPQDLQPLVGGIGAGLTITLAGVPCLILGIDTSGAPAVVKISIETGDYSSLSLATGAPIVLQLRSNNKLSTATLTAA